MTRMNPYALMVLLFFGVLAITLLHRGIRSRVRRGRYEEGVTAQGPSFVTDEGSFVVNRSTQALDILLPSGTFHLPLKDIEMLQLQHEVREALLEELLFENFSLFDLHRKYRDHVHSYRIVARTQARGEVPLFEASQYEVRDFLDFTTPVLLWLLGLMGLHREADIVAREVQEKIRVQLRKGGVDVRGGMW